MSDMQDEEQIRKVARIIIHEMFETVGVDMTTPDGRGRFRDDLGFLREAREGTATMRKTGVMAIIGTVVTATALALWKGVGILLAVGGKPGG